MRPTSLDDAPRVKAATDLVELVGSFLPLQRSGSNFRALCPFHEEKTPSFYVFAPSQVFKCFGCNAAGDAITFVQKREGLAFPEALEWLAARAGVQLRPRGDRRPGGVDRPAIFACQDAAASFFERTLAGSDAIQRHLDGRGVDAEARKKWRIGLAPGGWQTLHEALSKRGFSPEVQIAAAVVRRADNGRIYDRFRDRVTFPIRDVLKRVIGFGARLLPGREEGAENGPKYLNSPESELFSKRTVLYGLEHAKAAAAAPEGGGSRKPSGTLAVMEGYTDVILAHAAGMTNAVATLGTALGREHARSMRNYANRILLLFDGDEAGLRASERGVGVLLEEGLEVRVAALPDHLDPADFVLERGGAAFLAQVGEGEEFFEFLGKRIAARAQGDLPAACDAILVHVAKVESAVRREWLVRRVAEWLALPERGVAEQLAKLVRAKDAAAERRGEFRPAPRRAPAAPGPGATELDARAAEELVGGLMRDPSLLALVRGAELDPRRLRDPGFAAVLKAALDCAADGVEPTVHAVTDRLGESPHRELPASAYASAPDGAELAVRKAVAYFQEVERREAIASVRTALREAEAAGTRDVAAGFERELLRLYRESRGAVLPGSAVTPPAETR